MTTSCLQEKIDKLQNTVHALLHKSNMPHEMLLPSKAGPAAVEAQRIPLRLPTAISPFVPRSISTRGLPLENMPAA